MKTTAALFALGFVALMLTGCKTHEILVETVRTDTVKISKNYRDSIYVSDSIYVRDIGDTVWIERWHTRWRDRAVHDTTYIAHHDTVPKPYPVIKEVEKQLAWWQRGILAGGVVFWIGVLVILVYAFIRIKKFLP